jgi:hypothetical protein
MGISEDLNHTPTQPASLTVTVGHESAFTKSSENGPRRDKLLLSDRETEIVQLVAQDYR